MSDYAELREALAKFKQAVKCPPTTPNIVFGIISATHDLLADFDRLLEALKKIHNSNMCGDDCRTVAMNALLGVQS